MTISLKLELDPRINLKARRTIDGNILILDHEDMDIVLMPKEKKVLALAKDAMTDKVYNSQDRLYKFLSKKGVINISSIQGGNVYGSLEAQLLESSDDNINSIEVLLYSIGKFITEERPYFQSELEREQNEIDLLTDPDAEDSTELGEVPQEERKGSLVPGWVRGPYGMTSFYRY